MFASATQEKRRVLIVEDNPGDAELTAAYLEESTGVPFDVLHAANLREARATLAGACVDAVILDLNLPDSRGLDTLVRVRAAALDVTIIVLSGIVDERLRDAAIVRGADDVLTKGEAFSGLFARGVSHTIDRSQMRKHQEEMERLLEANPDAILVANGSGTVRYANRAALELFGRTRDALVGSAMSFPRDADAPVEMLVDGPGGSRTCEVRIAALDWEGEPALLRSIRDLTELKQSREDAVRALHLAESRGAMLMRAEGAAREHARRLESLCHLANKAGSHGDVPIRDLLAEAAAGVRPGQLFWAFLSRLDGADLEVIDIGNGACGGNPHVVYPGMRIPLGSADPRTRTWLSDGIQTRPESPAVFTGLAVEAVIATRFDVSGVTYVLTLASPEPNPSPFSALDASYAELLGAMFSRLLQVGQLERSLYEEEARTRRHAERLETLLAIVNNSALSDSGRWVAMLEHAAATILPDQHYRAFLSRVQGDTIVQEAIVDSPGLDLSVPGAAAPLAVIGLRGSLAGKVIADNRGTQFWEDLGMVPELRYAFERGWRSALSTTFSAAGGVWSLSFLCAEVAREPFGDQERAYIDLLGSFFANHVQQHWQFERLQHQQSHDLLTGLLNRTKFRSQARIAARQHPEYAIIKINLSDFREINEVYGHMIGDAMLVEVGSALSQRLKDGEFLGRVGGDVFGIYLPQAGSIDAVRRRAYEFADIFARPFSTGDRDGKEFIAVTASIGIAVAPKDGDGVDAIMSHADAALVATKRRGKGALLFFEPGMEGDSHLHATLRNEIAVAVNENQFELYFQPHVDLQTGVVRGCEALIRWNHPQRGLLLPAAFIPFAERAGIIASIDAWVMESAFKAAVEFSKVHPSFRLYFNLSGRQAGSPEVVEAFAAAASAGVPLKNIGVEITETDAMRDVIETRYVCAALRELGVRIALDDFGTGYSSLSSLKQLPIDTVKIDQSFVSGILDDRHDVAIAEAIIAISARFGFASLAEGAETPEQIAWLREAACDSVQGFGICHPLPMTAFSGWLREREVSKDA